MGNMVNELKWHGRFLDLAALISTWSKDPSTKVGAVIVRPDKTVSSDGFNGFPKGCDDAEEYYADRDLKLARVVHAELNALLHTREDLTGYTLYTYPPGFGPSCDRCTAHIIQAGIKTVVHYKDTSAFASRWKEPAERGLKMYEEAGVNVISIPYGDEVETQVLELPQPEEVREHRVAVCLQTI